MLTSVLALAIVVGSATGSVLSNADSKFSATIRNRDIENVRAMRTRIANMMPDLLTRDAVVSALDESAGTLGMRKALQQVPIMIHHAQSLSAVTDTTVVLAYGPEEDDQYDPGGFGAKLYFDPTQNPAGVKLNVTRKFAQLCDLVSVLETAKRRGESLYHGVPAAKIVPGLVDAIALILGHEVMHVAQFMVRPTTDLDAQRSKIKDGTVPDKLIDGARYERAYEQEAFTWEYGQATRWKDELTAAADGLSELRARDAAEFIRGGRFEYLGDGRRNEIVSHYLREVIQGADEYAKTNSFKFVGVMHLMMDAMVDVPAAANALGKANDDAIEGGAKRTEALRQALVKAEKVRHEYFERGSETDEMLEARPFLKDVRPKLDREIDRANGRLMGR